MVAVDEQVNVLYPPLQRCSAGCNAGCPHAWHEKAATHCRSLTMVQNTTSEHVVVKLIIELTVLDRLQVLRGERREGGPVDCLPAAHSNHSFQSQVNFRSRPMT